ncbi:MAG: MBL fold metallo-hydrolase [Kineosporiaceae bacterium]
MTLDGTATWIVSCGPLQEGSPVVIVDPGPSLDVHLRAVVAALGPARPRALLLTHGHADHAEAAGAWARRFGVPVLHPGLEPVAPTLVEELCGPGAAVLTTPGHTADSVCLLLPPDEPAPEGRRTRLLTGDTVLGRGSTVIASPDGDLGDYLRSLDLLIDVVARAGGPVTLLPGHGGARTDAAAWLAGYRDHRIARLAQVRAAMAAGARDAADVVRAVYPQLDPQCTPGASPRLHAAALASAEAQLRHLRAQR